MAYNQFPEHPDDSVGSWMLTLFVCGIPLVGFVYLLVLALGSGGSPAKRNFARAMFIWQIIGVVATILIFVLFGGAMFAVLHNSGSCRHPAGCRWVGGIRVIRMPPPTLQKWLTSYFRGRSMMGVTKDGDTHLNKER